MLLWTETSRVCHVGTTEGLTRWPGQVETRRLSSSNIGEAVRDGETRTCMSVEMTVNWRLVGVFTNVHEKASCDRIVSTISIVIVITDSLESEATSPVTHTRM